MGDSPIEREIQRQAPARAAAEQAKRQAQEMDKWRMVVTGDGFLVRIRQLPEECIPFAKDLLSRLPLRTVPQIQGWRLLDPEGTPWVAYPEPDPYRRVPWDGNRRVRRRLELEQAHAIRECYKSRDQYGKRTWVYKLTGVGHYMKSRISMDLPDEEVPRVVYLLPGGLEYIYGDGDWANEFNKLGASLWPPDFNQACVNAVRNA